MGDIEIFDTPQDQYPVVKLKADNLEKIQQAFAKKLKEAGIKINDRYEFNPHITLTSVPLRSVETPEQKDTAPFKFSE